MKKLLGILVLGLMVCSNVSAGTKYPNQWETHSEFWNTSASGPKSKDAFINKFLKNKELDPIEGVWMQTGYGLVGIVKQGDNYKKYLINVEEGLNGSIETTYFKTAGEKIYSSMVRIDFARTKGGEFTGKWYHGTSTGTLILKNENYAEGFVDQYAIDPNHQLIRQWPLDLYVHNKKINPDTKDFEGSEGSGDLVSGSGFFINNDGLVVTNAHVIKGCKSDKKINILNKSSSFKVLAKDSSLDLALLETKHNNRSYLKLADEDIGKVEKVIVAGYPLGKFLSDDLKFTEGIVSSLKGFQGSTHEMQIDAAINQGNSGGPVVNENGDLVGVAVATLSKELTEGINFAIKSSALETFLKSNSVRPSMSGYSWSSMNRKKLREHLEESTVYISCKL